MKCDEKRPVCERCPKLELVCEGYDRDVAFVNERVRASRPTRPRMSPVDTPPVKTPTPRQENGDEVSEEFLASNGSVPAGTESHSNGLVLLSPNLVSLNGFGDVIQQAFIQSHLFSGYEKIFPNLGKRFTLRLVDKDPAVTSIMKLWASLQGAP